MKNILIRVLCAVALPLLLAACSGGEVSDDERCIYSCDEFTVYPDSVVQGHFTAKAVSALELITNYRSPVTAGVSPVARFRFSLNGRDNEMDAWMTHVADVRAAADTVYTFGDASGEVEPDAAAADDTLSGMIPWTVRLDMRPVLRSFRDKGYYATLTGDTVWAEDFRGVWIAGGIEPLSWDFWGLGEKPDRRLRDRGDSIYELTLTLNRPKTMRPDHRVWKIGRVNAVYPQWSSSQMLVDALYNMAIDEIDTGMRPDSLFNAATRDISYSIYLSLALLDSERSVNSLRAKVRNGRIIQDAGIGGSWPVSGDRVVWGIAAWEIYLSTGDRAWLAEAYDVLSATLADDMKMLWDARRSLMHGAQSGVDRITPAYPWWMQPADIYASMSLSSNAVFARVIEILGLMSDELRLPVNDDAEVMQRRIVDAINDNLWMPQLGYYSAYLYGQPYPIASPTTDNLGQALAVIWGVASDEMAASVMEKTPVQPFGTPVVYPQSADDGLCHSDAAVYPFVQAFWNIAAARAGNSAALRAGLGAIYRSAALPTIDDDARLWSAAGNAAMVLRVIAGMDLSTRGIHFTPVIPAAFSGVKSLKGLRYRGSVIDIDIDGTGDRITSFKIDGRDVHEHILPADITPGHHLVSIVMDSEPLPAAKHTVVPQSWMPRVPKIDWADMRNAELPVVSDNKGYGVWLNGVFDEEFKGGVFGLFEARDFTAVSIAVVDNGVWGFAQRPHYFIPAGSIKLVNIADFAVPGTSLIADKEQAGRFVELTTMSNTMVEMTVDIAETGEWWADVRYANGSGPVNTGNRCALRTLVVNGYPVGPVVMPQRGLGEWLSTGWSNMLKITLGKGVNKIAIEYIEPFNINMDGEINTALVETLRLLKAG